MRTATAAIALFLITTSSANAQPKLDDIETTKSIAYVPDGHERQVLDLYVPKSDRPLPLLIWIHGGGWQMGSKANPPFLALTKKGFAVASINYRFSQHAIYPAQIHDCKAAVRYLRANAKKYNLDPDRFGVGGASAGGHLSALIGTNSRDEKLEGTLGKDVGTSSRVQAVFDLFGPTDLLVIGTPGAKSPVSSLLGGPASEKADLAKTANPIAFVSKDTAPFLIVHGEKDTLVPISQSELLQTALEKAGVSSTFVRVPNAGHGGPVFATGEANERVEAFFRKHLAR